MTADPRHSHQSSLREEYIEYVFLSELCKQAWRTNTSLEILRSQTDDRGYDLILESEDVQRHVQLKSSFAGSRTSRQTLSMLLSRKPSGCVVWVYFDAVTLDPLEYLWLGGAPGEALPDLGDRVARHTKADATGQKSARKNHRVVPKSKFETLKTSDEVFERLFGVN